jgi:chromate transporter
MSNVSFKEAFLFWLKLGFISFGGPVGQIAIMHEYLVEKKKWITEEKFLHALNYCMLLPGPEAQQLATYMGWLMHGTIGGIVAGLLFILPSVFIMLCLSVLYVLYGSTPLLAAVFSGIKPAVVAIVFLALLKISAKALKTKTDYAVAVVSLLCLLFFNVPYPVLILAVIAFGIIYHRLKPTPVEEKLNATTFHFKNFAERIVFTLSIFLLLWFIPFAAFYFFSNDFSFWKQLTLFFTQSALVTFGGAYSVLMYVSQMAVEKLHWLTQGQMIDGLALGETTPGPLIMVLTYVGFMGSYHHFNGSLLLAAIGLLATTFYTFLPSFAFILIGASVIESTGENKTIKKVLAFVTSAVVGVIANLSIYTAKAVLFTQSISLSDINFVALLWMVISVAAMKKFNINMILWIFISALFGAVKMFF